MRISLTPGEAVDKLLRLWDNKLDTCAIAEMTGQPEHEVARVLWLAREARRNLKGDNHGSHNA